MHAMFYLDLQQKANILLTSKDRHRFMLFFLKMVNRETLSDNELNTGNSMQTELFPF
jgi:hypothetical protein